MESLNAKDHPSAEVNDHRAGEEVLRLRRTVRDLVALSSLPSIWVDYDLDPSLQNLTDVLRATLRALTVCMRIEKPDGARFETGACEGLSQEGPRTHNAVALLDGVPTGSTELVSIPGRNGARPMNALAHPVFANGRQIGKLVACFREDFFPAENERLILQVAASQIMLLLQRHKAQEERFARKLAEDRLRQTEHHYQQLVQSLPTAVFTCDTEGRITLYNEAAAALWGRRPKIGEDKWCDSWNVFKTDGKPFRWEDCPLAAAIREGRPVRGREMVVERPDGTRSIVLAHPDPIRDESGAIIGAVNMLVPIDELKSAEQALRASEVRLQSLLNLMPAAVYACDREGRITFYNRRAAELWGREPRLNDNHQKFCAAYRCWFKGKVLAPEDTPMAMAVNEGKSFRNLEPVFERPDGVRVSVLVNIDPILDGDGKPAGAINVFQDVTPLKFAEAELSRKNNQLAAFLETAALGMHRVGPDGIIQWANAAEMEMLGYAPEEYVGQHIARFHADQPAIDDILKRLSGGEKLCEREARLRCKDGSIKHVLIDSSGLWEDGEFMHTQCFTRDITDRQRAQENTSRLAAIVEHSDDAILSTDLDGIIKTWNRGARDLYGYTPEEAIGQSVTILLPENRQDEESRILGRMRQGQTIENYETLRRRKDGSVFDVSLTVSPVRDASGHVIGASKVARDITDKVRAKEKLEKTVAERTASLREAVAQMEEFSYTVSHDLRAPLRGMQAYAEALLQDFASTLPAEATHYLNRIATNATRLDKMILDVLRFSRIGRAELRLERVNVDKLVRQIVEQYPGMQAPDAEVQIKPLHDVLGHEPSLTQAISNLLNNAVKFVAPNVKPKVCVWSEEPRAGWVRLWVADNGLGVNPKYQHRLFGMFERVHADLKYEGTGVGLAIVRRAVERMGGKVGLESDGVNGSRFWIELRKVVEK